MAIHCFDTDIAEKYGLEASIILNNIYYWVQHNEANEQNFYDGHYWTFNSVKAFNEIFPYISERKIRNALKFLEDEGILITGNYNKVAYDRTKWYAITEKGKCILSKRSNAYCQNEQMDLPYSQMDFSNSQMDLSKNENGNERKGEPIPNINSDYKPVSKRKYKTNNNGIVSIFESVPDDLALALDDFIEMRKKIKAPITERGLELIISKVNKLSNGDVKKSIEIVNQSVENSWKGVFPIRKENIISEHKKESFSFMDIDF